MLSLGRLVMLRNHDGLVMASGIDCGALCLGIRLVSEISFSYVLVFDLLVKLIFLI